ncbi:MAG: hypothetical protein NC926_10070 [Candidatus Omnitrophica bacterium]|nr:hypothetical protein [Candidatus Omnitrophota bacterium]
MKFLKKIFSEKGRLYFWSAIIILSLAITTILMSQTLCQNADLCLQDFDCDFNGECKVTPSSFQYRLVPPPCGEKGDWSNWDNDQCGAHYPWYALGCLIPVRGCGGLRAYPDENCP